MKNIEIPVVVTTEMGCVIYTAVTLPEDYSMGQLVRCLREEGYTSFMTDNMRRFVEI